MKKEMILKVLSGVALLELVIAVNAAASGITVYEEGDKFVKIGGRMSPAQKKILVDDDDKHLLTTKELLVFAGYEVVVPNSPFRIS